MSSSLDGKVALVTGGSRGIGKGIAQELAAVGATVYLTARSIETAQQVVEEIQARRGRAVAIRCDHADDDQVRDLVRRLEADAGRLDILVNNVLDTDSAGASRGPAFGGKPFWQVPLDASHRVLDVGMRSHFTMTVLAMPLLVDSRGLVVNISSAGGETYYLSVAYGVGKSAADRMIRDMAHETGPGTVTFVSLWPGFVSTERTSRPEARGQLVSGYARIRELVATRTGSPVDLATPDAVPVESQRFAGKAVVALAADPDVNRWTGRVLSTPAVAKEYGYADLDGTIPDAFGFLQAGAWAALAALPDRADTG